MPMNTADYAFFISLASAIISIASLIWNVWQKYIFVKPQLQVGFSIVSLLEPKPANPKTLAKSNHQLLVINVTNMGPGPVTLYTCVAQAKRDLLTI